MSRDVVLAESLAQCLREPFGYAELQGFTALRSPLRQQENCGMKPEDGHRGGKAADIPIQEPSSPPQSAPPTSSERSWGVQVPCGQGWGGSPVGPHSGPKERRPSPAICAGRQPSCPGAPHFRPRLLLTRKGGAQPDPSLVGLHVRKFPQQHSQELT